MNRRICAGAFAILLAAAFTLAGQIRKHESRLMVRRHHQRFVQRRRSFRGGREVHRRDPRRNFGAV